MRVLFLFNSAQIIGGGEIGLAELMALYRQGTEVEPVPAVPGPGEVWDLTAGMGLPPRHVTLPSLRGLGAATALWHAARLRRLARREQCDLIHANGARCMLYAGLAARLGRRLPVLWHVRVLERDRRLDRWRARLADRIVCNSRAVAQTVTAVVRAADTARLRVVYNGIRLDLFRAAQPAQVRAELQVPPDAFLVLVVGRLVAWKGQRDVIAALGLLTPEFRARLRVVFVGRDLEPGEPYRRELLAAAAALDAGKAVIWAGQRQDVPALMKAADLLLVPSHGEPFGRIIVEAWAAGLPVLATETGGAGEIIGHGATGWLIPERAPAAVAGALRRLVPDGSLRAALRENGLRRAEDFSLAAHAANILAVYRELVPSSPAP